MRDGHPDDDRLADLAADVLPLAEARAVEAHVLACERCSLLLADAERIRGLLVAGDPGPMPADVWARIEAALGAAGTGSGSGSAPEPAPVPLHTERVHPPAAWDDDADPFDAPRGTPFDARRHGSSRAGRGSVPSRREARSGGRRPGRGIAVAVVGVAAAAVIGVVAVNALHVESGASSGTAALGRQGDASSAAAAGGAAGTAAAAAVRYERTGTAYTSAALARQAQALTRTPPAAAAPAVTRAVTPEGTTVPAVPAPEVKPPGSADRRAAAPLAQVAPDPTATDISNPANLDGCLAALKTSPDRLVAVDLATYQDREAAVLVLHAVGGGYEVFVVERSCSASDDHSLAYTALKG